MTLQLIKLQTALVLFIFTCMGELRAGPAEFAHDVLPILQKNCVSCHVTGEELGGLGLAPSLAYRQLVNVPSHESTLLRVKPGAPEESYLLHKLNGTHLDQGGSGGRMPLGLPPLADTQLALIRQWIQSGAPNN